MDKKRIYSEEELKKIRHRRVYGMSEEELKQLQKNAEESRKRKLKKDADGAKRAIVSSVKYLEKLNRSLNDPDVGEMVKKLKQALSV